MNKETALKDRQDIKKTLTVAGISFFITAVLTLIFFALSEMSPFGKNALLYRDGEIQMVDLFCWYKDVLTGRSSIDYTLTKSLGGSNFSVFTYYLASPLSLLVVFFDKSQIPAFINMLFLIKAALAASFMSIYLTARFRPGDKTRYVFYVILSATYASNPFFITQSSNTMWLDGAYMLPLVLMGAEQIAHGKKSTLFTITAALAVCFNWYSGIIDLMFACFWFLFELASYLMENGFKKDTALRKSLTAILRYALSCICALLLASAILVPTLLKLSGRTYGKGGLSMLLDFSFMGSVPDTLLNYSFGMISIKGHVSLFAGSFVLIGTGLLFLASLKPLKEKILYGILLLFTVLMFIWQPLVALFSMLRVVESFWYRYTYLGIFALIYLASTFYLDTGKTKVKAWMPPVIAGVFSLIEILLFYLLPARLEDQFFANSVARITSGTPDTTVIPIAAKVIFPIVVSAFLSLYIAGQKESNSFKSIISGITAVILASELLLGQLILAIDYSTPNSYTLADYFKNEEALLGNINDDSFYRVVQTSYHSIHVNNLPASYNEPMAFGFNSVTSFVSDPDENTITFMDNAGYKSHSETITVTTSENLAADSLLGVKYVMLPAGDTNNAGLEKIAGTEGFKDLYLNPYSFPAAFVYSRIPGSYESTSDVPALNLNDMYKKLTGISKDIFIPAASEASAVGNDYNYRVNLGDSYDPERYILYADFVTNTEEGAKILVNGDEYTNYSMFLAPSMVRIKSDTKEVTVTLRFNENIAGPEVKAAHFYLLDLSVLKEAVSTARANQPSLMEIKDGYGRFEIDNAEAGLNLFVSIPREQGWHVMLNGNEIIYDHSSLMSIPLKKGKNTIEIKYSLPHKTEGIAASLLGVVLLAGIAVFEKKKLSQA